MKTEGRRGDVEKKVEVEEEERGDTVVSRACQSVLSVPADKNNLSEYSSTSKVHALENYIFFYLILGL